MRKSAVLYFVFFLLITGLTGCTSSNEDYIAWISPEKDSSHETLINDIFLGRALIYELQQIHPEDTWVQFLVEIYQKGQPYEKNPLIDIKHGLGEPGDKKSTVGLVKINLEDNEVFFVYATRGETTIRSPMVLTKKLITEVNSEGWEYAIPGKKTGLKDGETRLVGIYRQKNFAGGFKIYGLEELGNEEIIQEMIESEQLIVLFKIRVSKDL